MSLITDINQMQQHVVFDSDMDLDVMNPHIAFAERYIKKIIGGGLYDELIIAIDGTPTAKQAALLLIIRGALTKIAVAGWAETGVLSLSKSGIRRIEDSNEKSAYKYQEDALRLGLIHQGFTQLDDVVMYLEENADDFATWVADPSAYTLGKQFFITNTAEFQAEYHIHSSPTTYRAFHPIMKHLEYLHICKNIGDAMYNELKTQMRTCTLTAENRYLLDQYIRPAMAHLTIADACFALAVDVSESGVRVIEMMQTFPSNLIQKTANASLKEPVRNAALTKGNVYIQDMMAYLNANATADTYAAYYTEKLATQAGTDGNTYTTRKIYRA
jgi:hypothetical protein